MNLKYLKYILWAVVLIMLGSALTRLADMKKNRELAVKSHSWDKIALVLEQIENNYVDSIDYKSITESTLPFILKELDPHSLYLPPQDLKEADEELEGGFDGIGITFNVPADTAIVINVIHGGPSEKSGLVSGDRIIKVGDKNVAGVKFPQDSLVKLMRGPSGTKVHLTIKRDSQMVPFEIIRDKIPVKSIDVAYMINDTTGYIKLSKFSRTSYKEFTLAMEGLKKEGLKCLIFDLKDNTGGYMDQALLLSNEFLKKGDMIVYMKGRHRPRQDFYADGTGKSRDIALKVLINESSASSSEIFAGAIQDNDRGTIYGRRSFGKGLVQEPINFTDNSGIRLTVARYYTPTGRFIQKPYKKGEEDTYVYDIYERYKHGEMTDADSIPKNDSLKFVTPGGKVVYGGGGIIPDVFVPIDTVDVTDLLIKINRGSLQVKFSIETADHHRKTLQQVKNLDELNALLDSMNLEDSFKKYLNKNNIEIKSSEWNKSSHIIMVQIRALIGRYSSLEDNAFYPILSEIDNVIQAAVK